MNDIFIDANVAKNFANPVDPEYKKIIAWLKSDEISEKELKAYLAVSKKIINKYIAACANCPSSTCMPAIIDKLSREGRLNSFTNNQISEFKRNHFKKHRLRHLRCNSEDRDHIPVVLLSNRKYAISIDDGFIFDITNFPGFIVIAEKRPELVPYDKYLLERKQ